MAQAGSSVGITEQKVSLKRKRISTDDEDLQNMPPSKISPKNDDSTSTMARDFLLQSTSPDRLSRDENVSHCVTVSTEDPLSEPEFTSDDRSIPSLSECPSSILSVAESLPRGDSTPHSNKRESKAAAVPVTRKCPFPGLSWADAADVWKRMCDCDERSTRRRDPNMFSRHPNLQPRMRAILFDWLNEVCEVYKLHRETFHLTVDYVDRFLANTADVPKGQLQLLGITCLFIAAKVEEVYPPKIGEFAYVTDGACTQEEILREEVCVLKILSWSITPITTNEWLNVYMQLFSESRGARRRLLKETDAGVNSLRGYTFVFPQYSSLEFAISAQLIDLAVLHVGVNAFPYSVVAAAAMAHTFHKDLAVRVSGYQWEQLAACHAWLAPFAAVLRSAGSVAARALGDCAGEFLQRGGGLALICPDINLDESHRIQVHNVGLDMFDRVTHEVPDAEPATTEATPSAAIAPLEPPCPHTPPRSDQKSPGRETAGPTPSTSGRGDPCPPGLADLLQAEVE